MSRSEGFKTSKQKRKYGNFIKKNVEKYKKIEVIRGLIKSDKFYLAKDIIDEYYDKYGDDDFINHELAKYYARIDNYEEAKSIFDEIIASSSEVKYYSMYELAKLERFHSNFEEAENLLNQIISSSHENKEHAYLELAKLLIDLKRIDDAKILLNGIIEQDMPNKLLAYQPLLEIAISENDNKNAERYFDIVKNNIPKRDIYFYKACILFNKRMFKSAEKTLIHSDLSLGRNRLLFCQIEFELRKYDSVIEYIEPNIKYDNPSKKDSLSLLINTYIKECKVEEGINAIDRLKEFKNPDYDQINYLIGNLYYNTNDYDLARKFFNNIENKDSNQYYFSITKQLCMLLGEEKYEEARVLLNQFKDILSEKGDESLCHLLCFFLDMTLDHKTSLEPIHYSEQQMINYSKEQALDHIEKHFNKKDIETSEAIFNKNIDKEELFEFVTNSLCNDYLYKSEFFDLYYLPYENAGDESEEKCNYIKVVTLHDTHNIITMYPVRKIKENYKVLKKNK